MKEEEEAVAKLTRLVQLVEGDLVLTVQSQCKLSDHHTLDG